MSDREMVIKAYECCKNSFDRICEKCPYKKVCCHDGIPMFVIKKMVAQLKEQEPICLTKAELDDLNENQFVWIEGSIGYLYCLQIIGICREKTGVSDIQFNAPTSYVERSTKRYGKSYRIWTNKPTEEQRQAVEWE